MTHDEMITIKKAVELVEGFFLTEGVILQHEDGGLIATLSDQYALDALAAQLVRQVDALEHIYITFSTTGTWCKVTDSFRSQETTVRATAKGPDRTMNTITAIVESGVLDE